MVEHEYSAAETFRAHLEARTIGGEWVLSARPMALVIFKKNDGGLSVGVLGVVLAIIEDYLEKIVAAFAQIFHRPARREVAVFDALEITVRRASVNGAVALMGSG